MNEKGDAASIQERSAAYFKDKRVTVMGLGLLGRGVGDTAYLAQCGAHVTVTDLKSAEELRVSLEKLSGFPNIRYVLGRHDLSDFRDKDIILKAAGVAEDSPYLIEAKSKGIPIRMSADLFAEISGLPVIGVTGTRGKTTVAYMVQAILEASGERSLLAGNIVGISTLSMLAKADQFRAAVLELDSWQLQGFRDTRQSPHIAVITTFYEDHLSYYGHDLGRYLADKANIFLNQKAGDRLIIGSQAAASFIEKYPRISERAEVVSEGDTMNWKLKVPGIHNKYNAACARAAALAYGIAEPIIREALESFAGVPGRLELVGERKGVSVYNDTTAVIPEATCAALKALAGSPITLIMGGKDKGNELGPLVKAVSESEARVILLPGTGSDRVADLVLGARRAESLGEAVALALNSAVPGEVVLFSPAFSSIGAFANVFDRGESFLKAVDAIWAK